MLIISHLPKKCRSVYKLLKGNGKLWHYLTDNYSAYTLNGAVMHVTHVKKTLRRTPGLGDSSSTLATRRFAY